MSYYTDRYKLDKLPGQSLAVVECGIQICHPGHKSPRLKYNDYSAHFILEGKGTYTLGGKTYTISAGQGFLITPGANCIYTADEVEPWKYIYASFRGADDDVLVHNAGLDEENIIFDFPLDDEMVSSIYAMHAAGKKNEAKGYDVTGYFLLVMSRLVKANVAQLPRSSAAEHYIKRAKQYIEDNYLYNINVESVASHTGLDRTYLYRLFMKYEKKSPSKYLSEYRLCRAAEMLEREDLSINEIALSVGYQDISHFYKAFNSKYKMPPKKYRDTHYGGDTK